MASSQLKARWLRRCLCFFSESSGKLNLQYYRQELTNGFTSMSAFVRFSHSTYVTDSTLAVPVMDVVDRDQCSCLLICIYVHTQITLYGVLPVQEPPLPRNMEGLSVCEWKETAEAHVLKALCAPHGEEIVGRGRTSFLFYSLQGVPDSHGQQHVWAARDERRPSEDRNKYR